MFAEQPAVTEPQSVPIINQTEEQTFTTKTDGLNVVGQDALAEAWVIFCKWTITWLKCCIDNNEFDCSCQFWHHVWSHVNSFLLLGLLVVATDL